MTQINHEKLDAVYERIRRDPNFDHLRQDAFRLIRGEGDNPRCMIIGEAPGAIEVTKGRPFVGPAGVMLRRLMALANLYATEKNIKLGKEDDPLPRITGVTFLPNCWLTNVVKYRPSLRNRTPSLKEIQDSRKHLRAEWVAIGKPDIIITVGSPALTAVTGRKQSILARAAKPITNMKSTRNPEAMVIWPMIHPSFALREERIRPAVERHWKMLGEWLANYPGHDSR